LVFCLLLFLVALFLLEFPCKSLNAEAFANQKGGDLRALETEWRLHLLIVETSVMKHVATLLEHLDIEKIFKRELQTQAASVQNGKTFLLIEEFLNNYLRFI
jgi:DNA-binding GntR family transcriptional regulator